MNALTSVQWRRNAGGGKTLPGMGIDPLESEEKETVRLTVELPKDVSDFLERYANYRNALNELQNKNVAKWSRKSAAEALLGGKTREVMAQMAEAMAKFGPLPEKTDEMLAYARRVLNASEKKR